VGPGVGLHTEARGRMLCLYRRSNPVVQYVVRHYTNGTIS